MSIFYLPSFNDDSLWQQAMTHSSFANEQPNDQPGRGEHNERLEFLGDAILTFVSGAYLYTRYPERPEGELTAMRAALVDRAQLCHFARSLNLDQHLKLGKGAASSRQSARLLCSAFEALIGAYFLDTGQSIQTINDYVTPMFDTVVEDAAHKGIKDDKTCLQEQAQQQFGEVPAYIIVSSSGPDHAKEFVVEVRIQGKPYGRGQGTSKQAAEKAAAKATLAMLS